MSSLRQYLAGLLALTLAAGPAYAGPEQDARAYVESTRQGARDKARLIFHQYLQEAQFQAANVLKYSDTFEQSTQNLANQTSALEKLRLQLAQAVEKADAPPEIGNVEQMSDQLMAIYQSTGDLYAAARTAEKNRDYLILKNGQADAEIKQSFNSFLRNIQTTCSNGIAANFEYPDLPPIRPIVPSYSFGVNVSVDGGGNTSVQPQVPSVQTKKLNGDTATAVYTTSYAGGWILGAYLVTGKIILTGAAAAGMTASQVLAASGIGLGVAAVVALVVYFDGLFSAIEQSREVSNALWIVHNEKADAETVRAEFKNICRPFADRAAKIQTRVNAIKNGDAQAIADLKAESDSVQADQDKLNSLQKAMDDELVQIKKDMDSDPNIAKLTDDQRSELAMKRLAESQSYTDMQTYIKSSQTDFLMNMFEVSLINIGTHITDVDKAMQLQYKDLFKNQTDQHLAKIQNLAVMGRRLAIPQSVRDLVQAEVKANARIAGLFREFDSDFAGYVQTELTIGQDETYKPKLVKWLEDVKAAQKDLPASPTLKMLVTRGESFLKFLGAGRS